MFQATFEPAFLPIGTEVSAKYRGAFCEAKVKKLVRSVKLKVSLLCHFWFTYVTIKNILLSFSPCCQMERYGKTPSSSHRVPSFSLWNRSQRGTAVSVQVYNSLHGSGKSTVFCSLYRSDIATMIDWL